MSARWRGGAKPHDTGNGLICASFGARGDWLSVGRPHVRHGFVELSGMPGFDEGLRGHPNAVRQYRAAMTDPGNAFLALEPLPEGIALDWSVRAPPGEYLISQVLRLRATGTGPPPALRLRFRGRLDRPALAMITEVGRPLSAMAVHTWLTAEGARLHISAPELPAQAAILVEAPEGGTWHVAGADAELSLPWPANMPALDLRVTCELRLPDAVHASPTGRLGQRIGDGGAGLALPAELREDVFRMQARALTYVRECTALRVGSDRLAILTDHRLLPLSWTRDAYYQALLLLRAGHAGTVADHLRWLWLSCDRPAGIWARSHHANGSRKDDVYQVDQQLYPLLELADFWRATGELPELDGSRDRRSWPELVSAVVDGLLGRLSEEGLLPTDENAADDPAGLPYLLANQILGWHTFRRLIELPSELHSTTPLQTLAKRLREAVERHFTADGPGGPVWAYSVDGRGASVLYHDANDVPTALAPLWGFCTASDPIWRATMDYAFSPANPGYAAGPYGGLGSRHTPGVWPLGLLQQWVARSLAGDHAAADDALRRLVACAMADGSLPEASDPATGRMLARPWFAWPGALLGALLPIDDHG
ncbi:hypothetical protein BH24CHL6_BH24CHL6_08150 [soil metagenome]